MHCLDDSSMNTRKNWRSATLLGCQPKFVILLKETFFLLLHLLVLSTCVTLTILTLSLTARKISHRAPIGKLFDLSSYYQFMVLRRWHEKLLNFSLYMLGFSETFGCDLFGRFRRLMVWKVQCSFSTVFWEHNVVLTFWQHYSRIWI